ncbi:MAG: presqualene diphosphate synthase HpnD [Dehalococcoidia bacterium]|nr:presqualene diphosphate synthase HpnD [Dehalococcoidia bacterium]
MTAVEARHGVADGYAYCRDLTRREARNFYYGFMLLPEPKRSAIYAAYAFARLADDTVDSARPRDEKLAGLAELRRNLDASAKGSASGPLWTALADTIQRFNVPLEHLGELLDGCQMDLDIGRYESWDDARRYCHAVASSVGLVSLEIFGYSDQSARRHAADLGIALQLTNILRDLREDAERDRIYIPLDEIRRFGYSPEELFAGVVNDAFRRLMAHQVARARECYGGARRLLPLLDRRSAACCAVMQDIYSGVLDEIERRDYDVFSERASVGKARKLAITARYWAKASLGR